EDGTGPDGGGGSGGITTQAEAVAVTIALFTEMASAMANMQISGVNTSGSSMPNFTFSGNCSGGGKVSGNGTINQSQTGITYALTYAPANCKVQGQKSYTINGDPNIKMHWSMPTSGQSINYSVDGGIKWDGGSCKLDYTMDLNQQGRG